ncbi:proteasome assembly chaperone 1-like isoform X1 [Amphibalanus amphitrite]|uniref:proteasome assembly chaperone 1-like isoform X1 n=1 Tax=Amphibalanus amphitrite TaxID=1232801 RepID=UPI001C90EDB3|nr:proteasome assembly chaperone 1-like isoform X1 [Amphibalanus amphitrite]XP_043192319.1 proteasome assembly chaperone 1-like isoform X1 [Amphibalanus amphitrite]XP_043192320.1 proteasome assembly chaperone 1-like isoform X1 [Amphibalanus amphitrite]XP_043192321.1 proteasome assembly chaperone 1-like isoform X1 [Amphibalanus amphitrite]XP_043192323.1 proteasome assembly chaperone 1-like isoform X1 [Amphibalanus amphitrite]XP_043235850.1 proteasome assembly chaperone 1-like isoform X1 [Amphib
MATFFGEVLPVTNRAYNDAEDDEEATHDFSNPFTITFSSEEGNLSADTVILACGHFATAYVDCLLPADCPLLATVELARRSEPDGDALRRPAPAARLYRLGPRTCVARCDSVLADDHHYWLAETVLSQFEGATRVVALGSAPLAEYLSSAAPYEERPSLLVRCLATSQCKLPPLLTSLEPPNVVKGTPAAVLSRCCLARRAACLLMLYTSALRPDAETAAALHGALSAVVPAVGDLRPRPTRPPADAPHIYM